jgi:hypothetical protein
LEGDSFHYPSTVVLGSGTPIAVDFGNWLAHKPSRLTITGPTILLNSGPGVYTGRFELSGYLCGVTLGGPGFPPCVVDLPSLSGSGQVIVILEQSTDNKNELHLVNATYYFGEIPEPSTFLLTMPAGLAIFWFGRRWRG